MLKGYGHWKNFIAIAKFSATVLNYLYQNTWANTIWYQMLLNLWQSDRWKHLIVLICISLVINIILHLFIDFDIFSLWVKRHVFCSFFCQWFILFLKWLWEYLYTKKERAFNGFFAVVQEILVFLMIPKNFSTQSRRKMLLTFKEQWVSPKMERGGVVCR